MNVAEHLARVQAGLWSTYSLENIPEYIEKKTYLRGRKFSFKGHEFQFKILSTTETEINTQKCSQVGMTEAQLRWTLAVSKNFRFFSTIYTMPFSTDAENTARTRVDPIINDSPDLSEAVSKALNNSEIKQIGTSLIYFRGTQGTTQAISIPADCVISDEIDRSDPAILDQYTSRLSHSAWKLRRNFSTPTVDGYGIALKMLTSRRYRNICKCEFCNERFIPDYYQHVKIPGFDRELNTITKRMLIQVRWKEARLHCPKCGKTPSLLPEFREWVWENNDEPHDAIGYYVSPFDALWRTPADLVKDSTNYRDETEFKNQGLGITAVDPDATLSLDDLVKAQFQGELADSGLHAMGCDLGMSCRIIIGKLDITGVFVVVHRERVMLSEFERRVRELSQKYRVVMKVFDAQPYTDLILRLQAKDVNLFACYFSKSKTIEPYKVNLQKEDKEKGKLEMRQVVANKHKAFDELVGHIKKIGMVTRSDANENDEFNDECLDMKRIRKLDEDGSVMHVWEKSTTGNDHYFHALLYCYIAARLRGMATNHMQYGTIFGTMKLKQTA